MDASLPEVRALLRYLEDAFVQSAGVFIAHDIGKSLVGLSAMDAAVPEVAALSSQLVWAPRHPATAVPTHISDTRSRTV